MKIEISDSTCKECGTSEHSYCFSFFFWQRNFPTVLTKYCPIPKEGENDQVREGGGEKCSPRTV